MPHLNNQALSTLRARQNAGGGAAGLAAPQTAVLGPTAVPVNGNVPAALATPNVPLASPQASGLVNNIRSVVGQATQTPAAVSDVRQGLGGGLSSLTPSLPPQASPVAQAFAPVGGGIAGNLRALVDRATAGQQSRGTSFGRQNTDGINPQSLL